MAHPAYGIVQLLVVHSNSLEVVGLAWHNEQLWVVGNNSLEVAAEVVVVAVTVLAYKIFVSLGGHSSLPRVVVEDVLEELVCGIVL